MFGYFFFFTKTFINLDKPYKTLYNENRHKDKGESYFEKTKKILYNQGIR